jgi:hypothetical protein
MSTAMGANVQLHYCMGKLVEWQLGGEKKDHCSKCGMKKMTADKRFNKKKCCEDEFKELKLKKDQRAAGNVQSLALAPAVISPVTVNALPDIQVISLATAFPVAAAPPGLAELPAFLLYCNFRV